MPAEQSIAFKISWAARLQRTRFDARARSVGLTRAQWTMIATIRYVEGSTQSEIASQLEINSVTAGRIIDRLEAAGWVERRADPEDRRANRIYLTPLAAPMLDRLAVLGEEESRVALQGLSEEEQTMFRDFLGRMIANMIEAPVSAAAIDEDDELIKGSVLASEA